MKKLPMFVYGTLKEGHGNWKYYLKDKTVDVKKATLPSYKMYSLGVPMIFKDDTTDYSVHGEVHFINPDDYENIVYRIDGLESYNRHSDTGGYLRREVTVTLDGTGEKIQCWAYIGSQRSKRLFEERGIGVRESGIY